MKACLVLLVLVSLTNGFERHALADDDLEEALEDLAFNRRHSEEEQPYLELRASAGSNKANTGPIITLQNRALMNTRLRVLYTDENSIPFLAESGLLWVGQTKSVTLPAGAKNIKIIVEKDLFAENWRVAYTGTLDGASKCIRITGVTLKSTIKPCK